MRVEHELPHYVRRKTAKGRTYYYFALPGCELVRLPPPEDPQFQVQLARLYRERPAPKRQKTRLIMEQKVYFIGAPNGPIKIGVSCDPEQRCRNMMVGSPDDVQVLATTPGGRRLELAYHQRFSYLRMRGEWFERSPEILTEIDRLNQAGTKADREN